MEIMASQGVLNASLTIGQVAAEAGLQTSAIRYYEDVGILPKAARVGGKRRYDRETIDRLLLIRFCRRLGFRISDMRGLLVDAGGTRAKDAWRRLVDARLEEVSALIMGARAVQRVLRESRDCDCVTLDSCRFLREERTRPAPAQRGKREFRR
jgi:MerR family redox-sensitive transcriptional activator SoxR